MLAELKEKEYNQVLEKLPDYAGIHVTEGPDPWAHAISYLVISIDAVPDLQLIGMHIFPPRSKRTIDSGKELGEFASLIADQESVPTTFRCCSRSATIQLHSKPMYGKD